MLILLFLFQTLGQHFIVALRYSAAEIVNMDMNMI